MKEGEEGWRFWCDHDGRIRDFVVGHQDEETARRAVQTYDPAMEVPMPDMKRREFIALLGGAVWYDAQDDAIQADLLAVMETLEAISRDRWPESCFKQLENRKGSQCEGLVELILEDDAGIQYRIFGFAGPRNDDFTMLVPFRKNDDPTYKHSCKEAQKRKAEVINDWNRAREWEAPQSD